MQSFRDPVTGVLKAFGFVASNAPGDLAQDEADDFALEPGKWKLVDGVWVAYQPAPAVPAQVTMRQARLALNAIGKLASVDAAIAGMVDPQKTEAQIEWQYSSTVERDKPLVLQLGPALGLSDADLDNLFITAAGL